MKRFIRPIARVTVFAFLSQQLVVPLHAYAQVTADPGAIAAKRPTVTSVGSVPVVNIAAPNSAGLSHNQYRDFNVGSAGVVLNNSTATTTSRLAGSVAANPNLTVSATTILNEVTGTSPSLLQGMLEVAGPSTKVIVANPNGITCNGCGFINTPRVSLTTGVPGTDDPLQFTVSGGTITVGAGGLDVHQDDNQAIDRLDLVARSILLNGAIGNATVVQLVAGQGQWGFADGSFTSTPGATASGFVIDASAVAPVTAGRIEIQATDAGAGVRMAGNMSAWSGDIHITAAGDVQVGDALAKTDITVQAGGNITATGTAGAYGNLTLTGANIDNVGTSLLAAGNVTLTATGLLSNDLGLISANGDVAVNAANVSNLGGQILANGNLTLTAANTVDNSLGFISAAGANLTVGRLINESGTVVANGLTIGASSVDNYQGVLSGQNSLSVTAATILDNTSGRMEGGNLSISAPVVGNEGGTIVSTSGLSLTTNLLDNTAGGFLIGDQVRLDSGIVANTGGLIGAQTSLAITADALDNRLGIVASNGTLDLTATTLQTTGGAIEASGNASITTQSAFTYVPGDQLLVGGNLTVSSYGFLATAPLTVGGALTINSTGNYGATYGDDGWGDMVPLETSGGIHFTQALSAGGNITLTATDSTVYLDGPVTTPGNLTLQSFYSILRPYTGSYGCDGCGLGWQPLRLGGGATVGGNLTLANNVGMWFQDNGPDDSYSPWPVTAHPNVGGDIILIAPSISVENRTIYSNRDLIIQGNYGSDSDHPFNYTVLAIANGHLLAARDANINIASVRGDFRSVSQLGEISAGRDALFNVGSIDLNTNVWAGRDISVATPGGVTLNGLGGAQFAAGRDISIVASNDQQSGSIVTSAQISAGRNITIEAPDYDLINDTRSSWDNYAAGSIAAGGDIILHVKTFTQGLALPQRSPDFFYDWLSVDNYRTAGCGAAGTDPRLVGCLRQGVDGEKARAFLAANGNISITADDTTQYGSTIVAGGNITLNLNTLSSLSPEDSIRWDPLWNPHDMAGPYDYPVGTHVTQVPAVSIIQAGGTLVSHIAGALTNEGVMSGSALDVTAAQITSVTPPPAHQVAASAQDQSVLNNFDLGLDTVPRWTHPIFGSFTYNPVGYGAIDDGLAPGYVLVRRQLEQPGQPDLGAGGGSGAGLGMPYPWRYIDMSQFQTTSLGTPPAAVAGLYAQTDVALDSNGDLTVDRGAAGQDFIANSGGQVQLGQIAAGENVHITAQGDMTDTGGSVAAGQDVNLDAGGTVSLTDTGVSAGRDVNLDSGGTVSLTGTGVSAGNDVTIDAQSIQIASLAYTNEHGQMQTQSELSAGHDLTLDAPQSISNAGSILKAGNDINLITQNLSQSNTSGYQDHGDDGEYGYIYHAYDTAGNEIRLYQTEDGSYALLENSTGDPVTSYVIRAPKPKDSGFGLGDLILSFAISYFTGGLASAAMDSAAADATSVWAAGGWANTAVSYAAGNVASDMATQLIETGHIDGSALLKDALSSALISGIESYPFFDGGKSLNDLAGIKDLTGTGTRLAVGDFSNLGSNLLGIAGRGLVSATINDAVNGTNFDTAFRQSMVSDLGTVGTNLVGQAFAYERGAGYTGFDEGGFLHTLAQAGVGGITQTLLASNDKDKAFLAGALGAGMSAVLGDDLKGSGLGQAVEAGLVGLAGAEAAKLAGLDSKAAFDAAMNELLNNTLSDKTAATIDGARTCQGINCFRSLDVLVTLSNDRTISFEDRHYVDLAIEQLVTYLQSDGFNQQLMSQIGGPGVGVSTTEARLRAAMGGGLLATAAASLVMSGGCQGAVKCFIALAPLADQLQSLASQAVTGEGGTVGAQLLKQAFASSGLTVTDAQAEQAYAAILGTAGTAVVVGGGATTSVGIQASLTQQIADLRATLTGSARMGGNAGIAQIDIPGVQSTMAASSRIATPTAEQQALGIVGEVPETFSSSVVPLSDGYPLLRSVDSEAKILNNVAAQLGDNTSVSGTINLLTERAPCASCSNVIQQFQAKYPNIKINVMNNGGVNIAPTKKGS